MGRKTLARISSNNKKYETRLEPGRKSAERKSERSTKKKTVYKPRSNHKVTPKSTSEEKERTIRKEQLKHTPCCNKDGQSQDGSNPLKMNQHDSNTCGDKSENNLNTPCKNEDNIISTRETIQSDTKTPEAAGNDNNTAGEDLHYITKNGQMYMNQHHSDKYDTMTHDTSEIINVPKTIHLGTDNTPNVKRHIDTSKSLEIGLIQQNIERSLGRDQHNIEKSIEAKRVDNVISPKATSSDSSDYDADLSLSSTLSNHSVRDACITEDSTLSAEENTDNTQTSTQTGHITTQTGHITTQTGHITTQIGHITTQTGHITTQTGHITTQTHPNFIDTFLTFKNSKCFSLGYPSKSSQLGKQENKDILNPYFSKQSYMKNIPDGNPTKCTINAEHLSQHPLLQNDVKSSRISQNTATHLSTNCTHFNLESEPAYFESGVKSSPVHLTISNTYSSSQMVLNQQSTRYHHSDAISQCQSYHVAPTHQPPFDPTTPPPFTPRCHSSSFGGEFAFLPYDNGASSIRASFSQYAGHDTQSDAQSAANYSQNGTGPRNYIKYPDPTEIIYNGENYKVISPDREELCDYCFAYWCYAMNESFQQVGYQPKSMEYSRVLAGLAKDEGLRCPHATAATNGHGGPPSWTGTPFPEENDDALDIIVQELAAIEMDSKTVPCTTGDGWYSERNVPCSKTTPCTRDCQFVEGNAPYSIHSPCTRVKYNEINSHYSMVAPFSRDGPGNKGNMSYPMNAPCTGDVQCSEIMDTRYSRDGLYNERNVPNSITPPYTRPRNVVSFDPNTHVKNDYEINYVTDEYLDYNTHVLNDIKHTNFLTLVENLHPSMLNDIRATESKSKTWNHADHYFENMNSFPGYYTPPKDPVMNAGFPSSDGYQTPPKYPVMNAGFPSSNGYHTPPKDPVMNSGFLSSNGYYTPAKDTVMNSGFRSSNGYHTPAKGPVMKAGFPSSNGYHTPPKDPVMNSGFLSSNGYYTPAKDPVMNAGFPSSNGYYTPPKDPVMNSGFLSSNGYYTPAKDPVMNAGFPSSNGYHTPPKDPVMNSGFLSSNGYYTPAKDPVMNSGFLSSNGYYTPAKDTVMNSGFRSSNGYHTPAKDPVINAGFPSSNGYHTPPKDPVMNSGFLSSNGYYTPAKDPVMNAGFPSSNGYHTPPKDPVMSSGFLSSNGYYTQAKDPVMNSGFLSSNGYYTPAKDPVMNAGFPSSNLYATTTSPWGYSPCAQYGTGINVQPPPAAFAHHGTSVACSNGWR